MSERGGGVLGAAAVVWQPRQSFTRAATTKIHPKGPDAALDQFTGDAGHVRTGVRAPESMNEQGCSRPDLAPCPSHVEFRGWPSRRSDVVEHERVAIFQRNAMLNGSRQDVRLEEQRGRERLPVTTSQEPPRHERDCG